MISALVIGLLLTSGLAVTKSDIIVKTDSGSIRGVQVDSILKDETYYSFMGIPYAQAPVKELRFMPPKPHPGWTETLDATKETDACAQFNLPVRRIRRTGPCGHEDCLHLSIHTPKLPDNAELNLPVIIFMLHESYKVSHNASKDYSPDFFMKEDVILVTVNHRIGALGFLSFEDSVLPGNNGLRDVILALKWLKQNIHRFGGDPYRFTLMGSQDAAGMVDILLHSPVAKGLFSTAILQSGTSWSSTYFPSKARERAIKLAEVLEIPAVTTSNYLLKRLANVPASKITEAELRAIDADEARAVQKGIHLFGPIIEHKHPEAIITAKPEDSLIEIDIPVMIGYNSREAIEPSQRFLQKPQYLTFSDRDFLLLFPVRTGYHFKLHEHVYSHAIDEIKEFYFEEGYIKISKPGEYLTYLNDIMTVYPIDYTVRKYINESKADVFYYTFDYSGELNMRKKNALEKAVTTEGTWGASVGDELCYLFMCKPIKKLYKTALDEDSEEIKVLRKMIKLWTNFAKTGNPTPPGSHFTWKPATKKNKDILVISDDLDMKTRLHDDRIKFWDDWLAKYKELAVDGVVKDIKDEL